MPTSKGHWYAELAILLALVAMIVLDLVFTGGACFLGEFAF